jgi:cytochrome subunit of sulfide dehydrogenase
MKTLAARALAGLAAAAGAIALAQQPAPPAPSFAPPHLTGNGPRDMAANCAACHGTRGRAAAGSPLQPLAGRSAGEIVQIMGQFKAGSRPATVMHQIAKGFSDGEIAAIAAYFEKQ